MRAVNAVSALSRCDNTPVFCICVVCIVICGIDGPCRRVRVAAVSEPGRAPAPGRGQPRSSHFPEYLPCLHNLPRASPPPLLSSSPELCRPSEKFLISRVTLYQLSGGALPSLYLLSPTTALLVQDVGGWGRHKYFRHFN